MKPLVAALGAAVLLSGCGSLGFLGFAEQQVGPHVGAGGERRAGLEVEAGVNVA